ncbi:hypothetical protein C0991_007359, partial [Blastosporella zonata]
MPTLLTPARKPTSNCIYPAPVGLAKAGPETPIQVPRHKPSKRNVKKGTKLVAVAVPVKVGPYSHVHRLKSSARQKENRVEHPPAKDKKKTRPRRQRVSVKAISTTNNAPPLVFSSWIRPKENLDTSQVRALPIPSPINLFCSHEPDTFFPSEPTIFNWLAPIFDVALLAFD